MSHLKERKETNCLNCNAKVYGKYCHVCGQENIEPKETVGHLVSHFFQDITHFDGKFFSTVKYLLTRPGFLSREYMMGRRASYVNPVRLYIFASAFFFLIFFTFYQDKEVDINVNNSAADLMSQIKKKQAAAQASLEHLRRNSNSGADPDEIKRLEEEIRDAGEDISILTKDSTAKDKLKTVDYNFNVLSFKVANSKKGYTTLRQYDSLQKTLPDKERDGFITRGFERQNLFLKEKYHNDGRAILRSIANNFIHRFPQMLFISLPLFSFLLWLLYIRRKNYYYVNHAIFSIHLYCASFIIILAVLWLSSILEWFGTTMPTGLNILFTLGNFFYLYKAQRNFYGQRRAKTILKFILLLFATLLMLAFLFFAFIIFSTFTA